MEYKASAPQIKAAGEGKATVVIATLLTKDRDGDVLLHGAFGDQVVPVVGAHDWKSPAIGKAHIREHGHEAVADIEFYLTTDAGKNWYHAIKEDFDRPPATQEYSWGFSVGPDNFKRGVHNGETVRFLKASDDGKPIKIHEVSPVLVAAGTNTRSVSVKETQGMEQETPEVEMALGHWAVGVHRTETDLKAWDTPMQVRRIHATGAPGYFRQIFAAQNPHSDLTSKGSFAFPHHFLSADGEPGAASVRSCAEGLMLLERHWAGMLPPDELKGIHAHLASHLRDAGREAPELRGAGDARYPLDEKIELVLWRLEEVLHDVDMVRDMRARKGMALTEARLQQIDRMQQFFATLCALVKIKRLDQPSEMVLQELSAEARAEAFGRRIEEMRAKVTKEAHDTESAEIALRVLRYEQRLRK